MALPVGEKGANLLSLDGGGIKGISSLVILQAIMNETKKIEIKNGSKNKLPRLPVDYFHLTGGTSTGGIIALMLIRLGMSVEDAIDEYMDIGSQVFAPATASGGAKFPAKPLEDVTDMIVNTYDKVTKELREKAAASKKPQPPPKDVLLIDNKAKMFMCTTLRGRGETVLLRSYNMPSDIVLVSEEGKVATRANVIKNITIKSAIRATSAAPTYFPPEKIEVNKVVAAEFWDGGLLNNNPIDQLWRARLDLVGPKDPPPKVALVVSIGTSWSKANAPGLLEKWGVKGVVDWIAGTPSADTKTGVATAAILKGIRFALQGLPDSLTAGIKKITSLLGMISPAQDALPFLTNTEAKHLDFSRYIDRLVLRPNLPETDVQYFRFNTPTNKVYIDMADYTQMKELKRLTQIWVASEDALPFIETVAYYLAKTSP